MRNWKLIFIICLSFVACSLVIPSEAGVGSSSGADFLRLGGGARPLGMGEAYVAQADDISAMYYNPAGLAQLNFPEVLSLYNSHFVGASQMIVGAAYPVNFGVLGIGYSGLSSGDIQGYDNTGAVTSTFNTAHSSINLSLGRRITPNLSFGLGVKSISEKLEGSSASTFALDGGLAYRVNSQFCLGVSALNLGSPLKFVTENTPLPASYRLGAAFATRLFDENINLNSDLVSFPEGLRINLGAEYLIRNFLAIRVGSAGGTLRAGLGLYANLFAFDYAYLGHADLGAAHQVSISLLFGAEDKSKKLILDNLALGKAYLDKKKYSDAVIRFEKVNTLDPKNEEGLILLKKAQAELEREAFEKVFAELAVEIKRDINDIMSSGKGFLSQGKYLEALAEFSKALRIEPTNREALRLQSEAQTKMESQLIEQSQEQARSFLGEALKLVVTGKYKEALEQVDASLSKDPKNKQAQALQKKLQLIMKLEKK
ncbi:PorV/PorQ family protein [Candidatus Saganbacteria bacterium]|nr:PorV/PorQ family protein [Candidatus Saganbacteria bacterium]